MLAVIAKRKLTLATGHISPEESLTVIREARNSGNRPNRRGSGCGREAGPCRKCKYRKWERLWSLYTARSSINDLLSRVRRGDPSHRARALHHGVGPGATRLSAISGWLSAHQALQGQGFSQSGNRPNGQKSGHPWGFQENAATSSTVTGLGMAERVGFEPTVEFPQHSLSRRAPSTTRTPLRFLE